MSRRGWLLFLAMGVIWGVPYLLIKVAVGSLAPASVVLLRTVIGAALLLPVAMARGELRPVLPAWRPLVVFAVIEMAVPWLLLTNAERHISSSLAGLLLAAIPLVGALVGRLSGTERLSRQRQLGLLVGLVGVAALVGMDLGGGDTFALVQMAVVAVAYGLGVMAAALTVTAIGYLPVGLAQLPSTWPPATVVWSVVGLGVLCTALAFVVFFALIDEVGPVRATVITYVNPAVAILLGVLLLDEKLTIGMAVGFVLVIIGSVLATRRSPRPAAAPDGTSVLSGR